MGVSLDLGGILEGSGDLACNLNPLCRSTSNAPTKQSDNVTFVFGQGNGNNSSLIVTAIAGMIAIGLIAVSLYLIFFKNPK